MYRKCLVQQEQMETRAAAVTLFATEVTVGHLNGGSRPGRLRLTPADLLLTLGDEKIRIRLPEILEIQFDDFLQVCSVCAARNSQQETETWALENFGAKMCDFLTSVALALRKFGCESIFSQFSWNFRLNLSSRDRSYKAPFRSKYFRYFFLTLI
jgi:hypothetical protein